MEIINKDDEGWRKIDMIERQEREKGFVCWTVHHEDGSVTLEVCGVPKAKLVCLD